MINLNRLTNDIFDDERLSNENLKAFSGDHIIRMTNNDPGGVYAPLIAATTLAHNEYFGDMTDEATKEAISEGLTIATNNAREALISKLSNLQDLVAYKFGEDSSTYQEFYPQGMDEYHQAELDELDTITERFMTAATTHLNVDHPAEVTAASNLFTNYKNARQAQKDAFSEVDALRTGRRESRKVLTLQLTKNLLTIAIDFLDNPDGFDDYYDPQYLPLSSGGGETTENTVTISGRVTDMNTGNPIEGAVVTLTHPAGSETVNTDADGNYSYETNEVPDEGGSVNLEASHPDYNSSSTDLFIEPGRDYTADFTLEPVV